MKLFIAIITVLLLTTAMLFISTKAHADDFNYTGATAEDIDGFGWSPNGYGAIGGPGGSERLGLAQQFEIFQATHMTFLNSSITISPDPGTTTFNYKLYTDSTFTWQGNGHDQSIPVFSSIALTSQPLTYVTPEENYGPGIVQHDAVTMPFDYTLQPGKYWISEEGVGGANITTTQTYIDPPITDTHAVPETPTWICLIMGLFLMEIFNAKQDA